MADEGVFPKVDGDVLYGSEINYLHESLKEVYTGTGFNTSASGTSDVQEASVELTAVASTDRDYAKVKILATIDTTTTNGSNDHEMKAQIKETGGAYGDIVAYKVVWRHGTASTRSVFTYPYEVIATLTSGQKTNGYQIKVFSKITLGGSIGTPVGTIVNIQTVVEEA